MAAGRAQAASVMLVWEGKSETDFQGGLDELSKLWRVELRGKTSELSFRIIRRLVGTL